MTVLPAVRGVSPFFPLVVHAPHAGIHVPAIARENSLDYARLRAELNRLTDWYTADLFQLPGAALCATPVSRLVVDLERYTDDTLEPRAAVGQGVIYTHDSQGQRVRPDICLGTCANTPGWLVDYALDWCARQGLSVAVDFPYAGCLVPAVYAADPRVPAIMVEVNRGLYLHQPDPAAAPSLGADYFRVKAALNSLLLGMTGRLLDFGVYGYGCE